MEASVPYETPLTREETDSPDTPERIVEALKSGTYALASLSDKVVLLLV